jgi:hypothetical protein
MWSRLMKSLIQIWEMKAIGKESSQNKSPISEVFPAKKKKLRRNWA